MLIGLALGLVAFALDGEGADPRMRCFVAAYPDQEWLVDDRGLTIAPRPAPGATVDRREPVRLGWDDGRAKSDDERLEHADLEDTVAMRYHPGRDYAVPPPEGFEPGRIRDYALLGAMYGDTRESVLAGTEVVAWMPRSGGKPVRVSSINGVAAALRRVSDDLERELPADDKALVAKTAGVFVWREVRGTDRRSPHSYAIAIDVGVARSDYWDWHEPDARGRYPYKNRFPLDVVDIFERHGFVWGGKWYHFDTMHFEYRPELLVAPCVDGPSPLATLGGKELPR